MIIGLVENGTVKIYEDIKQVLKEWGQYPTDLLSEVIILYNEKGTWLEPIAKYSSQRYFKWLKKLEKIEFIDNSDHYQDSLEYMLHFEALTLENNKYFKTLDELRSQYPYINSNISN